MSRSNATSLVLAALVALSLTSASTTAGSAAAPPEPGWLLTQTATHGTLEPARCPCRGRGSFILTLRGADAQMVWFADRSARGAGQLTVRAFTRRWVNFGFRADHPNAALSLLRGHEHADTLAVELLSRPRYDPRRRTMRYVVRRPGRSIGALSDFEAARDRRVPRRFDDVSLFIDASGEPYEGDGPPDPGLIEPGDHDALPHIPATHPHTIPPDQGDAGRPASRDTTATGR